MEKLGLKEKGNWSKQLTLVFGLFGNCSFKMTEALKKEDFWSETLK